MPEVSAVLVNYNAGLDLREALGSVAHELDGLDWEAVVVDNASFDREGLRAADLASRVRLILNQQNVGFARAVNQGLAATAGPLVLIMNPDCRLERGAFEPLRAELQREASCALAGPRILDPDGAVQGSARGDPDMLTGLFGRTGWLGRMLPGIGVAQRNVVDRGGATPCASTAVDWVSGACMLARRDALHAVGGFDERYFLYWEDADLCRRLRAVGYQVRYVPRAVAVHKVGSSSRTDSAAAIRAFHESAYLYYALHVAPHAPLKRLLARVLLLARREIQLRRPRRPSPTASLPPDPRRARQSPDRR